MVYRCVKQFNPVDPVILELKNDIIRRMAADIIFQMTEEDFLKLFTVTLTDNHFSYYTPLEFEVKLIVK